MIANVQHGISFVALFKIEKKMISSTIGFALITKDKKLANINSSLIKMMGLDLDKLRKMQLNGFDLKK
jgi:hypothetical protein